MNDFKHLEDALQNLRATDAHVDTPARIEVTLNEKFELYKLKQNAKWRFLWWIAVPAAAAAMLLIVVSRPWETTQPSPHVAAIPPSVPQQTSPIPALLPESAPKAIPPARHARQRRVARPRPASAAAHEFATDFIPLRPVLPWEEQGSLQLVRVRVPRAELARFGLATPADPLEGTVRADVVLGQDGVAHAVRFIR